MTAGGNGNAQMFLLNQFRIPNSEFRIILSLSIEKRLPQMKQPFELCVIDYSCSLLRAKKITPAPANMITRTMIAKEN